MTCVVRYGEGSTVELELAPGRLLAVCGEPQGEPLADPAAAVEAALREPFNFPPLARATVPGDRIVLAVEQGVPQAPLLVAAVAGYLVEQGAAADHLAVLWPPSALSAGETDPRELLPEAWRDEVALEIHAPEASDKRALLGASRDGKQIYLNRTLLDADLVLPIGCLRQESAIGYYGPYGGLFPTFADAATQARFRKPSPPKTRRERAARERAEIDEVGWLLGTQFTVQALPGGGGRLLRVLAGEIPEVFRVGRAAYETAWACAPPGRASLVVAALSGGAGQQTWENLVRALTASRRVLAEGGAVALCTELAAEPGQAMSSLIQADDLALARRRIRRGGAADARLALRLARATEQGKVYLLSRLEESLVEDLGLAPIDDPGDVGRLARRHESCIALANAQYAIPRLVDFGEREASASR